MSLHAALRAAQRRAKATKAWRYVVVDCGEYEISSEFQLDTFFLGAPVVAAFGPDGVQVESL